MTYQNLTKGRVSLPWQEYHITTVTWNRQTWFADFHVARIVIAEMRRIHDTKILSSLAWVLMPDHLHWLFQLNDNATLSATINLFKGRSSRAVNQFLGRNGNVWQRAFYDHAIRKEEDLQAIARYIVGNPLRKGLVDRIGDYPYWDAIWL